jgi:glycosyltransferase involved in cell wall biosynthesis
MWYGGQFKKCCPAVLAPSHSAACLVDPESTESIREGILKVINDETYREDLIHKGFENVKRFAPEKISAQYAALYRAL